MPVKVIADLIVPDKPKFRISPGVYSNEIDVSYRVPPGDPQWAIKQAIDDHLFEPNDCFTREKIAAEAETYIKNLGFSDYQVVCDATNNSPWLIDNNQLAVDVYLKPQNTVQYINIRAVAHRTGVVFSELIRA